MPYSEKPGHATASGSGNSCSDEASSCDRRSFVKTTVAVGLGAAAIAAPVCGAVRMSIAPLSQEGGSGKFYPLTTVDALGSVPQRFTVIDDYRDAWTVAPGQKIGTVYIRRADADEGAEGVEGDVAAQAGIQAFQSSCPHAGCSVLVGKTTPPESLISNPPSHLAENVKTLRPDTPQDLFYCPCHSAYFTLDGKRLNDACQRDLDSLEVRVENGIVFVKYENFLAGIIEKRPG